MKIKILCIISVISFFSASISFASINNDLAVRAIIGEASGEGYKGMLAVASAIRNRGTLKGVYGVNAKHVDKEPSWVWDMARKAWNESEFNRVHSGDCWASIHVDKKWLAKMRSSSSFKEVYVYNSHVFFQELK